MNVIRARAYTATRPTWPGGLLLIPRPTPMIRKSTNSNYANYGKTTDRYGARVKKLRQGWIKCTGSSPSGTGTCAFDPLVTQASSGIRVQHRNHKTILAIQESELGMSAFQCELAISIFNSHDFCTQPLIEIPCMIFLRLHEAGKEMDTCS